ncbi:MAG: hypothetical protein KO202_07025 [Methanobacteriaceae archaeon]|jgi:hypothetical protein|nr:hypothetical protein [Methanobacteriaceae archaeon]
MEYKKIISEQAIAKIMLGMGNSGGGIIIFGFEENNNEFWLNIPNFSPGAQKAVYGAFLNGLMIFYMCDEVANEKDDYYNLNWYRSKNTIIMSGVNYDGSSYIHVTNPNMNMIVTGDTNSIQKFRIECSVFLNQIEFNILGLSELSVESSLSKFIHHLYNGELAYVTRSGSTLEWRLFDFPEVLSLDQSLGIVSVTTERDGFKYKGAISSENSYCYHDDKTDKTKDNSKKVYEIFLANNSHNDLNNKASDGKVLGLSEGKWDSVFGTLGDLSIAASAICLESYRYGNPYAFYMALAFGVHDVASKCLSMEYG